MMSDGVHTCASGTLVIFTRVEGLLRQHRHATCEVSRDAVNAVIAARVPLVLVSDGAAADVQDLQRELGLVHPFICRSGAELYVPLEYFSEAGQQASELVWERFSFETRTPAAAIRLLGALFIARGHDKILTVGLGCDCSDSTMLAAVDIPIVVRDQRHDQSTLLQYVPGAYLTTQTGAAGWPAAGAAAEATAEHVGVNDAGIERDGGHGARHLLRQGQRQALDSPLAGAIRSDIGVGGTPPAGAEIDDHSAARRDHRRNEMPDRVHGAADIHVEHAGDFFGGNFPKWGVAGDHLGALLLEQLADVIAEKAASTGDQHFHDESSPLYACYAGWPVSFTRAL